MIISSIVAPLEVLKAEYIELDTSSGLIKRSSGNNVPSQLPVLTAPGKTEVTFTPRSFNSSLKHYIGRAHV